MVGVMVRLMLNGLKVIVVVFSFCGLRIGSLLLVRKLVFCLDNVISVGLVSMCVMLLFCSRFRLVN